MAVNRWCPLPSAGISWSSAIKALGGHLPLWGLWVKAVCGLSVAHQSSNEADIDHCGNVPVTGIESWVASHI